MRISDWSSDVCSTDLVRECKAGTHFDAAMLGLAGVDRLHEVGEGIAQGDDIVLLAQVVHHRIVVEIAPCAAHAELDLFGLDRLERQRGIHQRLRRSCAIAGCRPEQLAFGWGPEAVVVRAVQVRIFAELKSRAKLWDEPSEDVTGLGGLTNGPVNRKSGQ